MQQLFWLEEPWFPGPKSYDEEGRAQTGASVDEHLLARALKGICAGPLAQHFVNQPDRLGTYAVNLVRGANGEQEAREYPYLPSLQMSSQLADNAVNWPGATVYDVLLEHTLQGLSMGPLVVQMAEEPEVLGALAEKIVVAAYVATYGKIA